MNLELTDDQLKLIHIALNNYRTHCETNEKRLRESVASLNDPKYMDYADMALVLKQDTDKLIHYILSRISSGEANETGPKS